ncbi:hypothetical protein C6A85_69955 [Mycobacterium sp. ITM-2017-0098]|nr:hypothetical protein C6A85_69955 [Mycobacterium sp. ITM-2017-0098]
MLTLVQRLVDHVRPALETAGDFDLVAAGLARLADVVPALPRAPLTDGAVADVGDVLAEVAAATLETP